MKAKVQFTTIQYKFWLAAAKERYGYNLLDWPKGLRDYHAKIEVLPEVRINLVQASIPYGNTGVSEGVKTFLTMPKKESK